MADTAAPSPAVALSADDLRAGVAAGLVTEAQAADLLILAQRRNRQRPVEEDEPFELFRGFSEIFVSVGLVLLVAGLLGVGRLFSSLWMLGLVTAAVCAVLARYFTLQRRMVLPSIVLVSGFALAVSGVGAAAAAALLPDPLPQRPTVVIAAGLTALALIGWYRVFRVPFTMFLLGLTGLISTYLLAQDNISFASSWDRIRAHFDLAMGSNLALGTLGFGLAAFALAMWFDTRDPHRLGRRAASGFWLHVLAAPALVNTVALTWLNRQDAAGYLLLAVSLLLIALLALVIDRRSFLTAGIGYLAVLVSLALRGGTGGTVSWAWTALILGLVVTLLGAWWIPLRASLMRALPPFPGKDRLPPYREIA